MLRPGIFIFFNVQGQVSNADRMTSVRLMAEEITPAIREYAKEIDLLDPYERPPGAVKASRDPAAPVVDRAPLATLEPV